MIIPQMPQNFSAQIVCPSPKVLDFKKKKASLGVRSPWDVWGACARVAIITNQGWNGWTEWTFGQPRTASASDFFCRRPASNWFRFVQWSLTMSDSWIQPHSSHHKSNSCAVDWSSNSWYARSILSLYSLLAVCCSISLRRSSFLRFSSLTPKFLKFSLNWSFISSRVLT